MSLVKPIWRDRGTVVDPWRMARYIAHLEALIEVYESADLLDHEAEYGAVIQVLDVDMGAVAVIERQIRAEG